MSDQENFERIYGILQTIVVGIDDLRDRVAALEAKDAITKPLWLDMRADQQRILERMDRMETHLQQQDERMGRIEAHLQQQDERFAQWDEQMDIRFSKLTDKFELLQEDTLEWRAGVRDLKRRIIRLEPVN